MAPDSTPVPPRGGKKGASRPVPSGRPSSGGAAARSMANRRAAIQRQRQRRNTLLAVAAIGVVVVVVAVFVIVKVAGGGKTNVGTIKSGTGAAHASGGTPLSTANYAKLTSPSLATLAAAAYHFHYSQLVAPSPIKSFPITTGGKPGIVYVGAEYCPYCATERWPMILALSKFGTFSGLTQIRSNTNDFTPSGVNIHHLATLSFYGSTYTSRYLSFTSYELQNTNYKTLQTAPAKYLALSQKYEGGGIPLVDLDGKVFVLGAEYDPGLLAGFDQQQIIDQVAAGTSTLSANIDANAGMIISNICKITGGRPGNVCHLFPKPVQS
ncbi:MAG: DUF929 family protein [Acidimicrobiales bacterium]